MSLPTPRCTARRMLNVSWALAAAALLPVCVFALGAQRTASTTPSASASLIPTPMERFASLDGMRIFYENVGSGEDALVFVHGWSCDHTFFRSQIPAFASSTRVLAIDLPGHGRSDKPEIKYTPDLFARAVDGVLRDAGVRRAVLVGHSLGTAVIRQFYRDFPEKTRALVVVDGMLRVPVSDPAQLDRFLAALRAADYKDAMERMVDGMLLPQTADDMRRRVKETMLKTPQHVVVGAMEEMFDPAVWKPDPIRVPLLVVLAKSPAWGPDTEPFIRTLAPDAEIHMMEGVSHFLMLDRPQEFNAYLSGFLAKQHLLTHS